MSTYSDGAEVDAIVHDALADQFALTITAPVRGAWHYTITPRQAETIWRYLNIQGAPRVTEGFGAEAATPRRHGDT